MDQLEPDIEQEAQRLHRERPSLSIDACRKIAAGLHGSCDCHPRKPVAASPTDRH